MRRFVVLFLISLLILTILNLPKVSLGIMVMSEDNQYKKTNYHYSSGGAYGFSVWSTKGFDDVLEQFEKYKSVHPTDTVLYRNFTKQYWKVWRWRDYLLNEQYQLPFKEAPSDARKISGGA